MDYTTFTGVILGAFCLITNAAGAPDNCHVKTAEGTKWGKAYDNAYQFCCNNGEVFNKTGDQGCCSDELYDKAKKVCCGGKLIRKTEKNKDYVCCPNGTDFISPQTKFCCDGKGYFRNDTNEEGEREDYECCPGAKPEATYVWQTHWCDLDGNVNKILPLDKRMCNGKEYFTGAAKCCGNELNRGFSQDDVDHKCCGGKAYSEKDHKCCRRDDGTSEVIGNAYDCCGNGKIYRPTQVCCGEVAYNKTSEITACCGELPYDTTNGKCCRKGDEFSLAKMSDAKENGACCYGSSNVVQAYDKTKDQCCGGQLIPLTKECTNDCDGKWMPNDSLCCARRKDERPEDIIPRQKPGDDTCCYDLASGKYKTINSKNESCTPQLGSEVGENIVCGSGVFLKSKYECCYGRAILKDVDNARCCGRARHLINNKTHDCCFGEIIDRSVYSCCEVLREKQQINESECPPSQMCAGELINLNHRMCCDGKINLRVRHGTAYNCCGQESVPEENLEQECCNGRVRDLGSIRCQKPSRETNVSPDEKEACRRRYDFNDTACFNALVAKMKVLGPGTCVNGPVFGSEDVPVELIGKNFDGVSIYVIMTTRAKPKFLTSPSGDKVWLRHARIVQVLSENTGRTRNGQRLSLLMPLFGKTTKCRKIVRPTYHRFILITEHKSKHHIHMMHSTDKLYKYSSRFVKAMQKYLYVDRNQKTGS